MSVHSKRSQLRFLVVIAAGFLGAAVVAIGLTVWWLRTEAIADASREAGNLATVLAEQTVRSVQSIELMLNELEERVEALGARTPNDFRRLLQGEDTYHLLTERMARLSHVGSISLVDNNGVIVSSTAEWPLLHTDISGTEGIRHVKDHADRGIYITKPAVDRFKGISTIFFVKRLNDDNNAFLGAVVIGIRLSYFQQIYGSITSLDDMSFLFLRKEGTVIVRYPDSNDHAGDKMPASSPWYRLVSQGGGYYRSPGYFDGIPRQIAVHPLRDYPLVVNVAVSETAALASWRIQAITIGIGTLLMIFFCVFLIRALTSHIKRLVSSEAALADEQAKVDAALNNMSQGLAMFDSSARLVVCNQRFLKMYGLPPAIVKPGCPFHEVIAFRIRKGNSFTDDVEKSIGDLRAELDCGIIVKKFAKLGDGRIISIVDHPTADGGWVTTHEDVTELKRAEEGVSHAAHHDALTDLANRMHFGEQLDQALKRVGRGEHFALLYLDLDNFKFINDTLGHSSGDELLKAVAGRLQGCIRDLDTLARLGGDEFAIIQAAVERPSDVAYLAGRIQEALKEPYDIAGHRFIAEASIGIAMSPDNGVEAEQLLKNADLAMYQAKGNGRGTSCFFEPEMDARVKARNTLEFELREAIKCGQFELHYQPVVNLRDGTITSCEALLRWDHPERGLILPEKFIPIAEETGLINQLGEWVLRTACAEAMTWPDNIKIAVNVSPVQFKNQALALTVTDALAESGLPARRLELEITETAIIHDERATLVKIAQLREMGVQIALDDFGTGYSSLSYLQRIPFDKIKIDQSFIKNVVDNDLSLAIVQAVITVAKACNVITVAEGVETRQQKEMLSRLGCSEMQGYLFSCPVSGQDLLQFFPAHAPRTADVASAA
jgi:diguanylate cyclase (GGDEF)-like protein